MLEQINILLLFTTCVLVVYLLSNRGEKFISNLLLSLFLLIYILNTSGLVQKYLLYPNYPGFSLFYNSLVFVIPPLLYVYVKSTIYKAFKLSWDDLKHLSFFALTFVIHLPNFYVRSHDEKMLFLETASSENQIEWIISYVLIYTQVIFYLILCLKELRQYKKDLQDTSSDAVMFTYKWLMQLVILFSFLLVVGVFKNIFEVTNIQDIYYILRIILSFLVLSLVCWMVLKGLKNPYLFKDVSSDIELFKKLIKLNNNQSLEQYSDNELTSILNVLNAHMASQKPYLDPDLSIHNLSEQTNIPVKDLSLILNRKLKKNFFDFINEYRIKEAMDILKNPENASMTVLEILYQVGFNSKSSFNVAFKKVTNLTPTRFRKMHLK